LVRCANTTQLISRRKKLAEEAKKTSTLSERRF
jgi:hypothetical protein